MKKVLLSLLVLFVFSIGTFAVVKTKRIAYLSEPSEIEKKLEKCLDEAVTSADMFNCTYRADEDFEDSVKVLYPKLLKKLEKKEADQLAKSQTAWENFVKENSEFHMAMNDRYNIPEVPRLSFYHSLVEMRKTRAYELSGLLFDIDEIKMNQEYYDE